MKYCDCGRPLPAICKMKGKCNWCASSIIASRRRKVIKKLPRKEEIDAFHRLMKTVWDLRKSRSGICRCHNCGVRIGWFKDATGMNFSHLLSKGAYPELYYDPDNVDILCIPCHQRYEFGDKENMAIWPEYQERIAILKTRSKFFRSE